MQRYGKWVYCGTLHLVRFVIHLIFSWRNSMQLKSISSIKSPVKQQKFGGWQELITEIVVDADYADGLKGIDDYFHLIILYWLHKVDKGKLTIRPQGKEDVPEVGIFACRCPWRLNPIGMTTVKVVEKNGNILQVKGVDVLDGTPPS